MLRASAPISPKLSDQEKRNVIYPYYAGFSEGFVGTMLDRMGARRGSTILDPWNGSGTTTYVAALRGMRATGIDLSPVSAVVARARLATSEQLASFMDRVKAMDASSLPRAGTAIDHLQAWYLAFNSGATRQESTSSAVSSLALCACFLAARQLLRNFETRNPSWFAWDSRCLTDLDPELIEQTVARTASQIAGKVTSFLPADSVPPTLITSDVLSCDLPQSEYDFVLTSPPYLTRLDYVKATLPELMLLSRIDESISISGLRTSMIGSPLVGKAAPLPSAEWGRLANQALSEVRTHPSKASDGYYIRFYLKYFDSLFRSIARIAAALRPGGLAVFVVQASHYKEIYIDLAGVSCQMGSRLGLKLDERIEYPHSRSMVKINTRAKCLPVLDCTTETALVFRKPRKREVR